MKKLLMLLLFAIAMPNVNYAGEGPEPIEQPELLGECKTWKLGDEIPKYFFVDSEEFNYWSSYKPKDYIEQINNKELLFSLTTVSNCPSTNRATAFLRLLKDLRLSGFKSLLNEMKNNSLFQESKEMKELEKIFSMKCLKFRYFGIDLSGVSKDKALKTLLRLKGEVDSGKDVMNIYRTYAEKIIYGGDFYISEATNNIFPSSYLISMSVPKVDYSQILKLKLGESVILEESSTKEDKELKRKYDNVGTATNDRLDLCIVTEELSVN